MRSFSSVPGVLDQDTRQSSRRSESFYSVHIEDCQSCSRSSNLDVLWTWKGA